MSSRRSRAPKALTKSELVGEIAEQVGLQKKQVGELLEVVTALVVRELKRGAPVKLPGLATFRPYNSPAKPARPGRNPATGETMMFKAKPASKGVRLRAPKALRDSL